MKWNVEIDISLQEILCWFSIWMIVINPYGIIDAAFYESVGWKLPLTALTMGAGIKHIPDMIKRGMPTSEKTRPQ